MGRQVFTGVFLFNFALVLTKEADLPLCPTNVLYFPQNLPMHCRMPTSADFPGIPGPLPTVPQLNQNPSPDKRPSPSVQIRIPGIPGPIPMPLPGPMPMPLPGPMPMPLPGPMPMPFPGAMPMPGPMGMPGPIPITGPMPVPPGPGNKLPVIVMPFYSPDPSFKKAQRPRFPQKKWRIRHKRRRPFLSSPSDTSSSTDTDTSLESSSSSSEYSGWWRGKKFHRRFNGPNKMKSRRHHQKRQLLTPVLQYVTKDGYVIFEKKISKVEAKDWLNVKQEERGEGGSRGPAEAADVDSKEQIDNHTDEKEMITENNIEIVTKKSAHRFSKLKAAHRNKTAKKKHLERTR